VAVGYLAPEGFVQPLVEELGDVSAVHGRLVIAPGPPRDPAWAQNVWLDAREIPIASIADAARKLRSIQRNWVPYSFAHHRRVALIEDGLPAIRPKPIEPFTPPPAAPLGSFTLLDRDRMLASPRCSSSFPHGEARFVEDREGPPSRAYLKLWELFTRLGVRPAPGERCIDLGASPGGWTWVLAGLGARVVAVDRAPLDPRVTSLPGVERRRESAFGIDPRTVDAPFDWLLSDVVCYPPRLLDLVRRWREAGAARRFVCTLKFQHETDHATARAFADIEGSRLVHLSHNRHELTWYLL